MYIIFLSVAQMHVSYIYIYIHQQLKRKLQTEKKKLW